MVTARPVCWWSHFGNTGWAPQLQVGDLKARGVSPFDHRNNSSSHLLISCSDTHLCIMHQKKVRLTQRSCWEKCVCCDAFLVLLQYLFRWCLKHTTVKNAGTEEMTEVKIKFYWNNLRFIGVGFEFFVCFFFFFVVDLVLHPTQVPCMQSDLHVSADNLEPALSKKNPGVFQGCSAITLTPVAAMASNNLLWQEQ